MKSSLTRRAKSVRPTFANVTALLALFFVLTSVAWAATLPKNSVGTKQLKKSAVSTSDIKNRAVSNSKLRTNAVTGSKVRANTLTGSDINESTLGNVPSASTASTVATSFGPISTRVQASASGAGPDAARAAAAEVPLLTAGQLTFYAKCFVDSGTNILYGEILVRTSADGAVVLSGEDDHDGDLDFLNVGTAENLRRVDETSISADDANDGGDDRATVIGADGNGVLLQDTIWLRNGTIPGSSPLLAGNQQCLFQLTGWRTGLQ